MPGFHVSARLRVCSRRALSRLRALFHVGAWCSDPGTHVLSFGFVSGFGHLRSTFCPVHMCFVVLHAVRVSIGCVHSCYILCCVARSWYFFIGCVLSCFHVLCKHVAYEFSLAACSCLVLHMAVDLFAGHVLVFLFCVSTWLLS